MDASTRMLLHAVEEGDINECKTLLKKGCDPNLGIYAYLYTPT